MNITDDIHTIIETLTEEEKLQLHDWVSHIYDLEMTQAQDLIDNCNITFQYAKTHSNYVKDWEKTRKQMVDRLENGSLPPGTSVNLFIAIIRSSDGVMEQKFKVVRESFESKFGESIYNYLGTDGKTKKLFGIF